MYLCMPGVCNKALSHSEHSERERETQPPPIMREGEDMSDSITCEGVSEEVLVAIYEGRTVQYITRCEGEG